jgi:tetratricopeptide (TPR) repeat protein
MNKNEPTSNEIEEIGSLLKTSIDERVCDKVNQLSKLNQPIDYQGIEVECKKNILEEISKEIQRIPEQMAPFVDLLKMDNAKLYEKLVTHYQGKFNNLDELKEAIQNCQKLEDFEKLSSSMQPLPESEREALYQLGEKWFEEGDFKKGGLYFSFLTAMVPKNAKFWLAKGMAEQNDKQYEQALLSYSTTIRLDSTLLLPYLQIIDCLILTSRLSEATQMYHSLVSEIDMKDYETEDSIRLKMKEIERILNKNNR